MSDLLGFNNRIRELLTDRNRESHWREQDADAYMARFETFRRVFHQTAARLIDHHVRPRLETLAGYFPHAKLNEDDPPERCSCWFGYCERFPASARIGFDVEHDARWQRAYLRYEAYMMPLFVNLNEQDRLEFPLDAADDAQIAPWVEDRLLEFLDSYLQIDRGPDEAEDEGVTDPVCGMRIERGAAAASYVYRGHPYFFCSDACQRKFAEAPTAFIQFKPM